MARERVLAIDIGGSGIKVMLLNGAGAPAGKRRRVKTPRPATPEAVLEATVKLAAGAGAFARASVGFPGVVRHGVTLTAPNLDGDWAGYPLAKRLAKRLERPVRVANDADVQGFGAIEGRGVELVLTLGTGFGSALFIDGHLVPNLELAHHPFRKSKTYEDELGKEALKRLGKNKWSKRLAEAIDTTQRLFNYDHLYLGGGNSKKIRLTLPERVTVVSNRAGLLGGIALWRTDS